MKVWRGVGRTKVRLVLEGAAEDVLEGLLVALLLGLGRGGEETALGRGGADEGLSSGRQGETAEVRGDEGEAAEEEGAHVETLCGRREDEGRAKVAEREDEGRVVVAAKRK